MCIGIIALFVCLVIQILIIKKLQNNMPDIFYLKDKFFLYLNKNIVKNTLIPKESGINTCKETYYATLIHDLKTPNSAQIRSINMLLNGHFGKLNKAQEQILKETLLSEKYMSEIVANILTAYKFDCGKLKLKKCFFDAADLLNNIYLSLKCLAEEKYQKININYHCTNLICYGDKLQISRVMTNLISNAIKYGFANSIININLSINSNELIFSVENSSNPIPKDKLDCIFDKFSGGVAHYNSASTGLGLYLSKKIIDMHNGKIKATSSSDGCACFEFAIPNTEQRISTNLIRR